MHQSVILGGARTPIGRLLGGLAAHSAMELGSAAIAEALARTRTSANSVQYVIMGQVLQAGCGQNPARQAAIRAGLPMSVPAITVNKVCLSGLSAIAMADQLVRSGVAEVVVAGGMESMSNTPHLLRGLRSQHKYGSVSAAAVDVSGASFEDSIAVDALTCAFDEIGMGEATERYNARYDLTRARQDEIAANSHARATAAARWLSEEIVAVSGLAFDEGVRADTDVEQLGKLRPAFSEHGTLTAGNSSQLSDGAAAVVVASKEWAERNQMEWLAEIAGSAAVAGPDASLHEQPARAIDQALLQARLRRSDVDLFEINEAFAAVAAVSMDELGVSADVVNVNGGAIALGHPVGMTGTRIALHLALELRRRGGGLGAAALCGGGGQGEALLLRVPSRP